MSSVIRGAGSKQPLRRSVQEGSADCSLTPCFVLLRFASHSLRSSCLQDRPTEWRVGRGGREATPSPFRPKGSTIL